MSPRRTTVADVDHLIFVLLITCSQLGCTPTVCENDHESKRIPPVLPACPGVAARPRAMMSSPTPAPLLPVAPLDGGGGYLRWKESVLLRLRTLDLAYVLSEHQPEDGRSDSAKKKRARDDELCRGHILATLSDRLLPDYAHHATAAAAWRALARTYDMDGKLPNLPLDRFFAYRFVDGEPVLEQLAHLEAMGVAGKLDDRTMYGLVHQKLPPALVKAIALASPPYPDPPSMDHIWDTARLEERMRLCGEIRRGEHTQDKEDDDDQGGGDYPDEDHRSPKRKRRYDRGPCYNCGEPGHIARDCRG